MPRPSPLLTLDARVAVIGFGAAGIAAVLGLRQAGFRNITAFEATPHAGGTWVYSAQPSSSIGASSMYASLRTNIPQEVMSFVGRPFARAKSSFVGHAAVADYLQRVVDEEGLARYARFGEAVGRVRVAHGGLGAGWEVQVWKGGRVGSAEIARVAQRDGPELGEVQRFDAVFVCNGHYSDPNPWKPEGFEGWPGKISHSHYYREPGRFVGKKVVVVGAGPSGTDIALELHAVGADVTLSSSGGQGMAKYGGVVPRCGAVVSCREGGGILTENGEEVEGVDELLLCTGYLYTLPFLAEESGVRVVESGRVVEGLLAQCVCTAHPTLAVIGLPFKVVPFPLFQDQVRFAIAVMLGTVPFRVEGGTLKAMASEELEVKRKQGEPVRFAHCMGDGQWDYRRMLAAMSGGLEPDESAKEVYDHGQAARKRNPLGYRGFAYVVDGEDWHVVS